MHTCVKVQAVNIRFVHFTACMLFLKKLTLPQKGKAREFHIHRNANKSNGMGRWGCSLMTFKTCVYMVQPCNELRDCFLGEVTANAKVLQQENVWCVGEI